MPLIHIKSLSFETEKDIANILKDISSEFSDHMEISEKQVIVTWDTFKENHYSYQGKIAACNEQSDHPILVDLIAPDFNSRERIQEMMFTVSKGISKYANISESRIFIVYRSANSGFVLDEGNVVEW